MIYRSKSGGVKRWAKMLTTAVLSFVLAIVVFASTAFAGLLNEYNVDIVVDGVTTTVTTREEKPTEILTNANITLESTDKLDLSGFEAGKGGKIVLDRQHTVNVEVNRTITAYAVYADTVGDALTEAAQRRQGELRPDRSGDGRYGNPGKYCLYRHPDGRRQDPELCHGGGHRGRPAGPG